MGSSKMVVRAGFPAALNGVGALEAVLAERGRERAAHQGAASWGASVPDL
jgi:hypothetical protein